MMNMRSMLFKFSFYLLLIAFAACKSDTTGSAETTTEATPNAAISLSPQVDAVTGYIDPVCQMKVAPDSKITHVHEGVVYGFCGEGCKAAFVADPGAFLAALED